MEFRLKPEAIKILRRVKRLILAEPKRIAMKWWIMKKEEDDSSAITYPKCGTVACVGGWVEELYRRKHPRSTRTADSILGFPRMKDPLADNPFEMELFFPEQLVLASNQQTDSHARAVAAHIDAFIERYS